MPFIVKIVDPEQELAAVKDSNQMDYSNPADTWFAIVVLVVLAAALAAWIVHTFFWPVMTKHS